MDTGTRSLRKAFRKGSWSDWPLAIGFSLFSRLLIVREKLECKRASLGEIQQAMYPRWRRGPRCNLNMRAESKTKLQQLVAHVAIPRQLVAIRVEPARGCLGTHPGELALGELARGGNTLRDGIGEAVLTLEVRPELAVADCAHRRVARREVTPAMERPHLIEEAGGHHRVEARGEALMQHRAAARGERPSLQWQAGERTHGRALQLGEPPSGREANLQSPLNSLAVVGVDTPGGLGVEAHQLNVKRRPAGARSALVDLTAEVRGRLWQRSQAFEQGTQIEHGAADQQRYTPARVCGGDRRHCIRHEPSRGVALCRIADVDEAMWQPGTELAGRLGGTNVEPPVDQRGIDAHDLDRRGLRQMDGPVALARARGTGEEVDRKLQRGGLAATRRR